MRLRSKLIYGFKASDIEDVREELEAAFAIKLRVFRNDAEGIR